jgi:hypothetical protein
MLSFKKRKEILEKNGNTYPDEAVNAITDFLNLIIEIETENGNKDDQDSSDNGPGIER